LRRGWTWIRGVIADRGEHAPIPIDLERTPEGGYAFRLGVRAGFGGQEVARIPVGRRTNPAPHPLLKEVHFCEVAGRTIEAANVYALKEKVAQVLETIAPGRALPLCYLRAPAMDFELPVYEESGRIVSPVVAGPKLRASDLAGIRRHVCRYLASAGYVADADEVEVGVLRPRDLSRVPPAAVFRSWLDSDVWLPTVEGVSPDGPVIGVLGRAARLRTTERPRAGAGPAAGGQTAPAAPDVIELLRYLRVELQRSRGDLDPASLYAEDVRPEIWRDAERQTEDTGRRLVALLSDRDATELELPVRRTGFGEVAVALEQRGITVLLAPDDESLAAVTGAYLQQQEFLRFATDVEIHSAPVARAERLEADDISTFGERETATANEPEEVHS
jgi:hypothetical protein